MGKGPHHRTHCHCHQAGLPWRDKGGATPHPFAEGTYTITHHHRPTPKRGTVPPHTSGAAVALPEKRQVTGPPLHHPLSQPRILPPPQYPAPCQAVCSGAQNPAGCLPARACWTRLGFGICTGTAAGTLPGLLAGPLGREALGEKREQSLLEEPT